MKKLFALLISVLVNATFFAGYAVGQDSKTPYLTQTFTASSIKEVESSTSGGSITLTGDAGSKATVEVYISPDKWSKDKIKQVLNKDYNLTIKVESGKLYVVAKPKTNLSNWGNSGLSISFKISVPKQVNSNLETSGGSIQISGMSGSQDFKTGGGSLDVDNVSGNTVGVTSGGSITVRGSKDNIDLKTSGGSIVAENCSGTIDLATSGGSLSLSNLGGNIKAATSGGSVKASNIQGTFVTATSGGSMNLDGISGNLEASNSGGNMDVQVKSVSNYVKLLNTGRISLTLPAGKGFNLDIKSNGINTSGSMDFRGRKDDKSMEGAIGNGGPEISVKSSQQVSLSVK